MKQKPNINLAMYYRVATRIRWRKHILSSVCERQGRILVPPQAQRWGRLISSSVLQPPPSLLWLHTFFQSLISVKFPITWPKVLLRSQISQNTLSWRGLWRIAESNSSVNGLYRDQTEIEPTMIREKGLLQGKKRIFCGITTHWPSLCTWWWEATVNPPGIKCILINLGN